jgi:protein SCO1
MAKRWLLLATLSAVVFVGTVGRPYAASLETRVLASPKALAPFNLEDDAGRAFSNERLKGRWSLVMLGFTQCPDVCPFTLQNLALVLEQMSTLVTPERLPQVVFLAVDPDRDRPVLSDYVKHFNDEFIGITGTSDQIKTLVESLEGYYRIVGLQSDKTSYQVHHSAIVSLIDPEARIRATLNPQIEPVAAAEFLTELMRSAVAPKLGR